MSVGAEYCFYFIALVLTKKTVIYEYTCELLTYCLGKEYCSY